MNNPTRVLAIFAGEARIPGACEIYRVTLPFYYMQHQSDDWITGWTWFSDLWRGFKDRGIDALLEVVQAYDVFVFPRMFIPNEEVEKAIASLFSVIRTAGKRIVYETDDDYTNLYRKVVDGDAITPAQWSDALTVTTSYLATKMRSHTYRPSYVLPNCFDPYVWGANSAPERADALQDKVIISLTGSSTHSGDWAILESVMPRVLAENPNAHFVVMGYHPDYLQGLPQTTYLDGMDYTNYAQVIRGSDIILAPVDPQDGFNNGKSPIKAIEGMAARRSVGNTIGGAAVIATGNVVYKLAVKDGKTGLTVPHTAESWYNGITSLVRNTALRTELQIKGHSWVYKNHDISAEWTKWAAAYRAILSKPANSLLPHTRYVNTPQ